MDSTRLSFFTLLKNKILISNNVLKAFVVRELRGFEMLFFYKKPKNPIKSGFFLKTAETSLRRLKTPT